MTRHALLIAAGGQVLDLACGLGRNARWLAVQGWQVTALDRDAQALAGLHMLPGVHVLLADVEAAPWPFTEASFDGIVVCRYLHRPLLPRIAASLKPGGILIYETFMHGQQQYGRPTNPAFLLQDGELLKHFTGFEIIAFEQGLLGDPEPAMLQRLCARRPVAAAILDTQNKQLNLAGIPKP